MLHLDLLVVLGGYLVLFLRMKSFTLIGLGWWGFLFVCLFSSYISMCTTQCLSGSSIFSNLVCYFSIFFISHNPGAGLKNTPKDRHKILKDSTL